MIPIKIAFCGRGGTGKTTLAHQLSHRLGLPIISECIRTTTAEVGYGGVRALTRDQRIVVQTLAFDKQLAMEAAYARSGFVSDRSVFDYIAYTQELIPEFDTAFMQRMVAGTAPYTVLFHVPPHGSGLEDDGFRFNPAFADVETRVCDRLLRLCNHSLKERSPAGRVDEVMAYLKKLGVQ